MERVTRLLASACVAVVAATAVVWFFTNSAGASSPHSNCVHQAMAAAPPGPGEYYLAACPGAQAGTVTLIGRGFPHSAGLFWGSHRHDGTLLRRGALKSDKGGAVQVDVPADGTAAGYSVAAPDGSVAFTIPPGR